MTVKIFARMIHLPSLVFLLFDGCWGDQFDPGLCSTVLCSVFCFHYFCELGRLSELGELSELSEAVQALNPQLLLVSQRLLCRAVQKARCRFERAILAHHLNSGAIVLLHATAGVC